MQGTYKGIDYVTTTASGAGGCVGHVQTNLGYVSEDDFKLIIDEGFKTEDKTTVVRGIK